MTLVNIEFKPELLERVDSFIKIQGLNRSEFVRAAVLEKMEKKT